MRKKIWKRTGMIVIAVLLSGTFGACFRKEKEEEVIVEEPAEEIRMEIPEREYDLYVAVPIEYMSMRQNPGFGDDVVTRIYPETMLRAVGETKEAGGKSFCHVATLDGAYEGYCAADYCIKVSYEYDAEELTVVDTRDARYTYEAMEADLQEIAGKYGEHVTLDVLGQSAEGRNLYRAVLGNPDAENRIFIQAGIHGREYMSCQQVMKLLEYYAANYDRGYYEDTLYSELFDHTVLHIIPMSNPDGVSISQMGEDAVSSPQRLEMMRAAYERDKETLIHAEDSNGDLYWYDTYANPSYDRYADGYDEIISYEEYLSLWKANANGVDINRNFGAGWSEIQQKENPGCEFFKGYSADSEPETIVLENQIKNNKYNCILNYHSRGQLIYYDVAGNSAAMSDASRKLAQTVSDLNRYQMVNCQASASVVLGGLGDYAMLAYNTPSITIEMGKRPCPLGSEEFLSIWHRGREVWAKVMKEIG